MGRVQEKGRLYLRQSTQIEILAQTAANLARHEVGALIVLQGADPLDRHIQGGVRLDGILSEELLESIFDPNSVGHDGAVIVDSGKVASSAAICPFPRISRSSATLASGTRLPWDFPRYQRLPLHRPVRGKGHHFNRPERRTEGPGQCRPAQGRP